LFEGEYDEPFWTSGNDEEMGAFFFWDSTGQTFITFSDWAAGEPDNGTSTNQSPQDCVALNNADNYKWNDVGCKENNYRFICEAKGENFSKRSLVYLSRTHKN